MTIERVGMNSRLDGSEQVKSSRIWMGPVRVKFNFLEEIKLD
jgi:hypothetical protein